MAHTIILIGTIRFGTIGTTHTWLPTFMKDMKLVRSTNELRRNRPDLWREISKEDGGDIIKYGSRVLRIYACDHIIEMDEE